MNIQQAIKRSSIQRTIGAMLLFSGALFYFVSLLMALYRSSVDMQQSALLRPLGAMIQNFIANIYEVTAPFIGFVWRNVPTLTQTDPFTYGNLLFLGLVGVMIVGKQLLVAGRRLRARIQRQIDRVEDMQWRNSMMQSGATAATAISANTIGQINLYQQPMPPNPEEIGRAHV